MSVTVQVPAKINLALCVGPRRGDGFHELATVFHAVSLFDEVTVEPNLNGTLDLVMAGEGAGVLPVDARNLAFQAAELVRERHGRPELGASITIHKAIPIAGGMAGGSADGAATLVACAQAWGLELSPEQLHEMAAVLGSDVPFSLIGGNALGRGRGELLEPLASQSTLHWVIAVAHKGLSTATVFRRFDELVAAGDIAASAEPPSELIDALATGDSALIGRLLRNDLQRPALDLAPELAYTIALGSAQPQVLGALVSGSGPTCVFLCASEQDARDVAAVLAQASTVRATRIAHGPVPGALEAAQG